MLFYKKVSGGKKDTSDLVLKAEKLILRDIGSSSYTEFENDESILDLYDKDPSLFEYRCGLIHSHHSMEAFFSGTDMDELYDNSAEVDYYLSLIVNNKGTWVARIASRSKEKKLVQTSRWFPFSPSFKTKKEEKLEEIDTMYCVNLPVTVDTGLLLPIEESIKHIGELQKKAKAKKSSRHHEFEENAWYRTANEMPKRTDWDNNAQRKYAEQFELFPEERANINDVVNSFTDNYKEEVLDSMFQDITFKMLSSWINAKSRVINFGDLDGLLEELEEQYQNLELKPESFLRKLKFSIESVAKAFHARELFKHEDEALYEVATAIYAEVEEFVYTFGIAVEIYDFLEKTYIKVKQLEKK